MTTRRVLRQTIQHQLLELRRDQGPMSHDVLRHTLNALGDALGAGFRPEVVREIKDEVSHDFQLWGPLVDLMHDATVYEIVINGHDRVFIERGGLTYEVESGFRDEAHLRHLIELIVGLDPVAHLDLSKPITNVVTPDGTRVNLCLPPVVQDGPHVTIRKRVSAFNQLQDLVANGTMDLRMATLLDTCVAGRIDILVSGPAGAGKTTLVELLAHAIDAQQRVIVIEDAPELVLLQPNQVSLVARASNVEGRGGITVSDLLTHCLAMSPDRIILGEISGREAFDYIQAIDGGVTGSMAVIRANSPEDAIVRLENIALTEGPAVPLQVIRRQITRGLELVVQITKLPDGSRKITRIAELAGVEPDGSARIVDLFTYQIVANRHGRLVGRFIATGAEPSFTDQLGYMGLSLDGLFGPLPGASASISMSGEDIG